MSVRPYRDIDRRVCRQIHVGKVPVGGDAPITVQSMTNTVTSDVKATVEQVQALERAGADIVRVSCPDQESALALKHIVRQVEVPIVADIHFHYKRAIEAAESGAACLRINPGNIGSAERVREVIKAAKDHGCSMRIGVNAGSLERDLLEKYGEPCPEAMVESALTHAKILEVLEERLAHITTPLTLSVIGCVVNGPGEARETDIGFTGGGNNTHQVYLSGVTDHRLKDADIVDHLVELVEKKAAEIEAAKREEAAAL